MEAVQPRRTRAVADFSKLLATKQSQNGSSFERTYVPGEKFSTADKRGNFLRSLPIQGSQRLAPNFTAVTRNTRFEPACALDMTSVPHTWYDVDNSKDVNAGRFEYYGSEPVDLSCMKALVHRRLMLPSERFTEAQMIKQGLKDYKEAKEANAKQAKQIRVTTHNHWKGLVGVDGPMYPDTANYPFAEDRQRILTQQAYKEHHADRRRDFLADKWQQDKVFENCDFANNCYEPPTRSSAIPLQRKDVDPVKHPVRWHQTHDRLHPKFTPMYDPVRAKVQISLQNRNRRYNIVTHVDNYITGIRARGAMTKTESNLAQEREA